MRLFTKVILLMLLLMLSFSMRGEVMEYANSLYKDCICEISGASSEPGETYQSWLHNHSCSFSKSEHSVYSNAAIAVKTITESNSSSNSYRFRRVVECNDLFKELTRKCFVLRGYLLTSDQTKVHRSYKDLHNFFTSSDYYVFTLRHILI